MSERRRPVFTPGACFDHDLEHYYIEVELPGVDKGHIEVSVSEQRICVVGSREDVDLLGCWYLGHSVNEDKAMHA
jgi:HSP20 family molecular chaperone IbpA